MERWGGGPLFRILTTIAMEIFFFLFLGLSRTLLNRKRKGQAVVDGDGEREAWSFITEALAQGMPPNLESLFCKIQV